MFKSKVLLFCVGENWKFERVRINKIEVVRGMHKFFVLITWMKTRSRELEKNNNKKTKTRQQSLKKIYSCSKPKWKQKNNGELK